MKANPNAGNLLEQSLLATLKSLDNQILRAMQKDPAARAAGGLQKWQPYQDRIELLCSFLLNSLGEKDIDLDGLIILTQAMSKALTFATEDLGSDGLGKVRSAYIRETFEKLARDAKEVSDLLNDEPLLT